MAEPRRPAPRPSQLYPQTAPHDIISAPSSASLQNPLTPNTLKSRLSPLSRPSSGPGTLQSQHRSLLPVSTSKSSTGYIHSLHPSLASPGIIAPGYPDLGQPHGFLTSAADKLPISQIAVVAPQAQKRAYRQRRKDPSCDACRERKVKCDATDSSSCTECTSRNVKCQFTKETNRRMSNIRHNQDLQKELAQAKLQVNHLRSVIDKEKSESSAQLSSVGHLPDPEPSSLPSHNLSHLPAPDTSRTHYIVDDFAQYERRSPKRRKIFGNQNLSTIGSKMQRHGMGIFKPPYPLHQTNFTSSSSQSLPELPPREVADSLVRQYHFTIHPTLPLVHWPSFQEQYEAAYRHGSLQCMPQIWSALLFAILACGSLHRLQHNGREYLEVSRSLVDLWAEDFTLDHARTALLTSIFHVEMNSKSAGWMWVGFAVRISFDIGLYCEAGTWPLIEEEMRRRVWWSIYACDCLLSLELGRPAMIKEEDCNVRLPSPIDDQYMHAGNSWTSPNPEQATSPLLPTIKVVGGIAKLLRMLKSPRISKIALETYNSHFCRCMSALPAEREIRPNGYIDPMELSPMVYLQNARLMLYRHNLKPICEADTRSTALDNCIKVSKDTARILSRCMQESPEAQSHSSPWEERLVSAISTFLCTHIWRCTLYLCFQHDFESALWCARASTILGNSRAVNVACGRYLEFFLQKLLTRWKQGNHFETDEEMIALVSGDLQGSFENSWVWQKNKNNDHLEDLLQSTGASEKESNTELDQFESATEEEKPDWAGWEHIVRILEQLLQKKQQDQLSSLRPPMVLPPWASLPNSISPPNRMSIKDLI